MSELANRLMPSDLVREYDDMQSKLPEAYENFIKSRDNLVISCSIMGSYGGNVWRNGSPDPKPEDLQKSLRVSAWRRVYDSWIKEIATAKDKDRVEIMLQNPPEFSIENLKDQFGDYIRDPWATILRGLAEVFCDLDPFYKSHTNVGVGKKGLPKRVIISGFGSFHSHSKNKLNDIVGALRAYRREPMICYGDIHNWVDAARKTESSHLSDITKKKNKESGEYEFLCRDDLQLKIFGNGNGHVFFGKDALKDINKALAEYYGEVLPDVDMEVDKKRASTEVSKDLQYYPTPVEAVDRMFYSVHLTNDMRVLEPSCGCGRIMDKVKQSGVQVFGIEYDAGRANEARAKGHAVTTKNFLEVHPTGDFDLVAMNPPFYGKHYIKHIEHALKFLKSGGVLVSILPSSARYSHKLIDKEWLKNNDAAASKYHQWSDLPVGTFASSGTNINTTILILCRN